MRDRLNRLKLWGCFLLLVTGIASAATPDGSAHVRYDAANRVFRLDAAEDTGTFIRR